MNLFLIGSSVTNSVSVDVYGNSYAVGGKAALHPLSRREKRTSFAKSGSKTTYSAFLFWMKRLTDAEGLVLRGRAPNEKANTNYYRAQVFAPLRQSAGLLFP